MKTLKTLKAELLADPSTRAAYDAQAEEFALARELIAARTEAGLTQADVAERMGTTQSTVAVWRVARPRHACAACNAMPRPRAAAPWCAWNTPDRFAPARPRPVRCVRWLPHEITQLQIILAL